jgi:RecA/RadA recombinase
MAKATTSEFMKALKAFEKDLENMDDVGTSALPPRYWYSTGNFVLNRIISGSFFRGIPQGRITDLAGASGAGKSFLGANLVKAAQQAGATVLVIDSENALDDEFMSKIGVDVTSEKYLYAEVTTIAQVTAVVSKFLKGYRAAVGEDEDAEQVLIFIDSLDMLMTDTEEENLEKGIQKGDQGQRNKQLKAMLRGFVQSIKTLNVAIICTSQVYKNQNVLNGEGVWIVSDAVKYACSQIILLSKLKLREAVKGETKKAVVGINMACEGYKTRFTKPFQTVDVEVPYDTGMDPYSGLADVLTVMGLITKKAGRYYLDDGETWFYESDMSKYADDLLVKAEAMAQAFISTRTGTVETEMEVDETEHQGDSAKARRAKKKAATE